jgi:hypothetical protein
MPLPIRRSGSGCVARTSSGLLPSPTFARLGPLGTSRFYTFDAADFASCCGLRTCSLVGLDAPLRRRALPRRREPATGPSGGYPDRTSTGWPCDASSGHSNRCVNRFRQLPIYRDCVSSCLNSIPSRNWTPIRRRRTDASGLRPLLDEEGKMVRRRRVGQGATAALIIPHPPEADHECQSPSKMSG